MHRILIVDDSPTIRKMVRASLQSWAVRQFLEAPTGLEAIEQLAVARVQLVVLDLNMPDMHGIDVLKFVRRNSRYKHIPIVVLTTRGDDSSRKAAEEAGRRATSQNRLLPRSLREPSRNF